MATAKEANGTAKLVADWAKSQQGVAEARATLEAAQKASQQYARGLYEAHGSKPFTVKALGGRKFRAMHKKGGPNRNGAILPESWTIVPIAENESVADY